ncbi:MAG: hypothetical protein J6Y96_00120 [Mycoplasma sp.]|nr:hypothetical protein [Mycoplasma sp.]
MLSRIKFKGDPCDSVRKFPKPKAPQLDLKNLVILSTKDLINKRNLTNLLISGIYKLVKANNSKY